jgi:hypothetical protein
VIGVSTLLVDGLYFPISANSKPSSTWLGRTHGLNHVWLSFCHSILLVAGPISEEASLVFSEQRLDIEWLFQPICRILRILCDCRRDAMPAFPDFQHFYTTILMWCYIGILLFRLRHLGSQMLYVVLHQKYSTTGPPWCT